jgi:hypothetical protein
MKQERANLRSAHLLRVARALQVPVETLVEPVAALEERHGELRTRYLWDGLFPDLDDFAIALNRFDLPAVARLVQVDGLHAAAKLFGRRIWTRFDEYKPWIHPVRRQQLEGLVRWRERRSRRERQAQRERQAPRECQAPRERQARRGIDTK